MRLSFICFLTLIFLPGVLFGGSISFLHSSDAKLVLSHAAYDEIQYEATRNFTGKTNYFINSTDIEHFKLTFNNEEYFLLINFGELQEVQIDLKKNATQFNPNFILYRDLNSALDEIGSSHLFFILLKDESFYKNALDSLKKIAQTDQDFIESKVYNTLVWDAKSAKKLYNVALDQFNSNDFQSSSIFKSSHYIEYWEFLYALYYQYFHANTFKGVDIDAQYNKLKEDFSGYPLDVLSMHHFFRNGIPLHQMEENLKVLNPHLSPQQKEIIRLKMHKKSLEKNISNKGDFVFLFGMDIDAALEGFFARDTSGRNNLLVFWSLYNESMPIEFNLLSDINTRFKQNYNFIYVCIDAAGSKEKAKAKLYRNGARGYHLIPEQDIAFRNSVYRKSLKIRTFPFYVITNNKGDVLETESLALDVSDRLIQKLDHFK